MNRFALLTAFGSLSVFTFILPAQSSPSERKVEPIAAPIQTELKLTENPSNQEPPAAAQNATRMDPSFQSDRTFAGDVRFLAFKDAMTDRISWAVGGPYRAGVLPYVLISGPDRISFVPETKQLLAPEPRPLMRVGKRDPFHLFLSDDGRSLLVPEAWVAVVLSALASGEAIAVRWYDEASSSQHDAKIFQGGYAAASEHASRVCDWMPLAKVPGPFGNEPEVMQLGRTVQARFGGFFGWEAVTADLGTDCQIFNNSGGRPVGVFSLKHGREALELPFGTPKVYDGDGRLVGEIAHLRAAPSPIKDLVRLAVRAGEQGYLRGLGYKTSAVPLFGFLDAVKHIEKTCDVSLHDVVSP
jgi:hypothetical protein